MSQSLHLLALLRPSPRGVEDAPVLASLTGLSLPEARRHLQGPGPRLLATFREAAGPTALGPALRKAGFQPLLLTDQDIETTEQRLLARSFRLEPDRLVITTREGSVAELPWSALRLILRGLTIIQEAHAEKSTERKFSLGKAMMTGGVLMNREVKKETIRLEEKTEAFLCLVAPGLPTVLLRETELLFQGLGPAMQPTRTGNFGVLVRELKSRAKTAIYEDRLANRAGQNQILGNVLPADQFLDVAIELLTRWHGVR